MEDFKNIQEGQTVYAEPIGNNARRFKKTGIIECKITSVKRKYFNVTSDIDNKGYNKFFNCQFYIFNGYVKTNYTADWRIHLSKEKYYQDKNKQHTWGLIQSYVSRQYICPKNFTLEQVKAVASILGIKDNQ